MAGQIATDGSLDPPVAGSGLSVGRKNQIRP